MEEKESKLRKETNAAWWRWFDHPTRENSQKYQEAQAKEIAAAKKRKEAQK